MLPRKYRRKYLVRGLNRHGLAMAVPENQPPIPCATARRGAKVLPLTTSIGVSSCIGTRQHHVISALPGKKKFYTLSHNPGRSLTCLTKHFLSFLIVLALLPIASTTNLAGSITLARCPTVWYRRNVHPTVFTARFHPERCIVSTLSGI